MASNIKEFLSDTIINYLEDGDLALLKKIKTLPRDSLVREFLTNCSLDDFEKYLRFEKQALDVHESYECEECGREWSYRNPEDKNADWYSGDTEFEHRNFWEDLIGSKTLPCCNPDYQNESDAECESEHEDDEEDEEDENDE